MKNKLILGLILILAGYFICPDNIHSDNHLILTAFSSIIFLIGILVLLKCAIDLIGMRNK